MSTDLHFESQAKADQHQLSHQIASYRSGSRLTRARAKHLTTLELRRDALQAPVYRLPDEVLSIIFQAGSIGEDGIDLKFSLLVTSVVSRWRRVALSTPVLWSLLDITLPESCQDLRRWKTFSNRSSSTHVDVIIELMHYKSHFTLNYEALALSNILPRCRTLMLVTRWACHRIMPSIVPLASTLPLRELHICRVGFRQLSILLDLLDACHCLVTLKLHDTDIDDPNPTDTRIVCLEHLGRLELQNPTVKEEYDTHTILRRLRTPRLNRLMLEGWDGIIEPSMDFSSVSSLVVAAEHPIKQAVVINLICSMPMLESLFIIVLLDDPLSDFPPTVSVPHLVSIHFSISLNVSRFARWLVEETGRDRPGGISVERVSMGVGSPRYISAETRQWMKDKGIELSFLHI